MPVLPLALSPVAQVATLILNVLVWEMLVWAMIGMIIQLMEIVQQLALVIPEPVRVSLVSQLSPPMILDVLANVPMERLAIPVNQGIRPYIATEAKLWLIIAVPAVVPAVRIVREMEVVLRLYFVVPVGLVRF